MTSIVSMIVRGLIGCAARGRGLATTKRSLSLSNDGPHKPLRQIANDEIMLLIKRVRQR
jgi:hypothetical protein